MERTTSSAAWLNGKLSRAKGAAARRLDRIAHLEVRIAFHQRNLRDRQKELETAKSELAQFLGIAEDFRSVVEMHESSRPAEAAPSIGPNEVAVRYSGLSPKVIRELRSGPLSVGDLRSSLISKLRVPADQVKTFRNRLNVVLNTLRYKGEIKSLDPQWTEDRRWALNPDYRPKPRQKSMSRAVVYKNSHGRLQPALWLIRTQQDLLDVIAKYHQAGTPLAPNMIRRLEALTRVWNEHPLQFEVACPAKRKNQYGEFVAAEVMDKLKKAGAWMLDHEFLIGPDRVIYRQEVSLDAIRKALKRLLLEGRVQRRRLELSGQVEWAAAGVC